MNTLKEAIGCKFSSLRKISISLSICQFNLISGVRIALQLICFEASLISLRVGARSFEVFMIFITILDTGTFKKFQENYFMGLNI